MGTCGVDPAGPSSASFRPGGYAQRVHHRQPVGEDHGKRGPRGYDAGKNIAGRKRHIVVDTMGLLLAVVVHAANIQSLPRAATRGSGRRQAGAGQTAGSVSQAAGDLGGCGYTGRLVAWAWATGGWLLTVIKRKPDSHHFEVLPRRWVVERTLAWLSRCRRLSKDYEERTESSETWVHMKPGCISPWST